MRDYLRRPVRCCADSAAPQAVGEKGQEKEEKRPEKEEKELEQQAGLARSRWTCGELEWPVLQPLPPYPASSPSTPATTISPIYYHHNYYYNNYLLQLRL